jgi:hypothetical protein
MTDVNFNMSDSIGTRQRNQNLIYIINVDELEMNTRLHKYLMNLQGYPDLIM